jgi:hypothetical protein
MRLPSASPQYAILILGMQFASPHVSRSYDERPLLARQIMLCYAAMLATDTLTR